MLDELETPQRWAIDLAAGLSQLGAVSLPPTVTAKMESGVPLNDAEHSMIDQVPAVTEQLLSGIPRLEPVLAAIRYSRKNYDGSGRPPESVAGEALPLGARILRIVEDFDELTLRGAADEVAIAALRRTSGVYDTELLNAFAGVVVTEGVMYSRVVLVHELAPGMVLDAEMQTRTGVKLVSKGQEITPSLLARIRNFAEMEAGVVEPVPVLSPVKG